MHQTTPDADIDLLPPSSSQPNKAKTLTPLKPSPTFPKTPNSLHSLKLKLKPKPNLAHQDPTNLIHLTQVQVRTHVDRPTWDN